MKLFKVKIYSSESVSWSSPKSSIFVHIAATGAHIWLHPYLPHNTTCTLAYTLPFYSLPEPSSHSPCLPIIFLSCSRSSFHQVLAVSSRSWLSYWYQSRFHLTPLSYELLEYASGFSSEQCPEGIVAIAANTLRILALEKLGAVFNQVRPHDSLQPG